jgi:hypothetical protein
MKTKTMKIELRNIKYAAFASQETSCFQASLYVNGVKRGTVSNEGHGGCNDYSDRTISQELDAYGKTLPMVKYEGADFKHEYHADADSLVGDLLTDYLIMKDTQRSMKAHILYTKANTVGVFQTKRVTAAQIATALTDPKKHLPFADKILNAMPLAEAVAIMKASS